MQPDIQPPETDLNATPISNPDSTSNGQASVSADSSTTSKVFSVLDTAAKFLVPQYRVGRALIDAGKGIYQTINSSDTPVNKAGNLAQAALDLAANQTPWHGLGKQQLAKMATKTLTDYINDPAAFSFTKSQQEALNQRIDVFFSAMTDKATKGMLLSNIENNSIKGLAINTIYDTLVDQLPPHLNPQEQKVWLKNSLKAKLGLPVEQNLHDLLKSAKPDTADNPTPTEPNAQPTAEETPHTPTPQQPISAQKKAEDLLKNIDTDAIVQKIKANHENQQTPVGLAITVSKPLMR